MNARVCPWNCYWSKVKAVNACSGGTWGDNTKYNVRCTYTVKINGDGFETSIIVENMGKEVFPFKVLLHNYFLVQDGMVLSFKRLSYLDL
jgi:hypothetical protein